MNFALSHELDYSLLSLNERKEKVESLIQKYDEELVEYYDNYHKVHLGQSDRTSEFDNMSKDLEKVADYLLYMDNKEQREKLKQEKLLNKRQTENRKKKEVLTDNFSLVENDMKNFSRNTKVYGKIKVLEQDRKEHKELAETGDLIKTLKYQILTKKDTKGNRLSNEQLKKLRWYLIEIGKDEVAIKEQLKRYITFKNIQPTIPFYDLKHFSFTNQQHIKSLFDNYSTLKEKTSNKTDNDFKLLLFDFEELIKKSIKEPILKKVFEMKINGMTQKEIVKEIDCQFNIQISQQRISQLVDEVIPNLISQKYKQNFEDWIYFFMKKGVYKFCNGCRTNKLATTKYFHKDNQTKDNLKQLCKDCRRKRRKKDT